MSLLFLSLSGTKIIQARYYKMAIISEIMAIFLINRTCPSIQINNWRWLLPNNANKEGELIEISDSLIERSIVDIYLYSLINIGPFPFAE